jgi:hypothetical protein
MADLALILDAAWHEAQRRAAPVAAGGNTGGGNAQRLRQPPMPATRVAPRGRVGARALAQAAGEVLVLHTRQREPGLEIAGRGLNGEKHGGGEGRELIGLQIVELDEADARPVRAHDQIASPAGGVTEDLGRRRGIRR